MTIEEERERKEHEKNTVSSQEGLQGAGQVHEPVAHQEELNRTKIFIDVE